MNLPLAAFLTTEDALLCSLFLFVIALYSMISRQNKRIKLLEDRVEELTARQSFASTERQGAPSVPSLPPVPPMPFSQNRPASGGGLSQAVQTLALQGNKIMAIKQLRDETGLGLAEAKNAVEAFLEGR